MHIVELTAQNIKNLKAISIKRKDNSFLLIGENEAGKSATLDCIFSALTGINLDDPIRKGEERAEITVKLAEGEEVVLEVKKIYTIKGKPRLEVRPLYAGETSQAKLDSLFSKISFDPSKFALMRPRDQRDLLAKLVGLDFSDLEADEQDVYSKRKTLNTDIKDVIAQNKNVEAPDPQTPDEEISYKEEIEKLNQLREKREAFEKAERLKFAFSHGINNNNDSIKIGRDRITELEESIARLEGKNAELVKERDEVVIPPEITLKQIKEAEDSLEGIERQNVKIRAAARYRKNIKAGEKLKKEADALTQRLDRLEQDKSTRTANAQFPIPGLSLSDDSVVYNDIPFSQISTGAQLRVSTAIAFALNPKAKFVLLREGSFLDDAGLIEVINMAEEKGFDVWIEKVGGRDKEGKVPEVGIFIEEGEIKSVDGKEVE